MTRFTRALVAALGVVFLGFVMTLVPQKNASGQQGNTQPVIVTNKTVPTTVTNTPLPISGGVTVGNFPATQNVNVTNAPLPVTGTVTATINGTPTVNASISNPSLSANISNLASNPVPVREGNSPDIYPFVLQFCVNQTVNGVMTAGECTSAGGLNGNSTTIPSSTPDNVAVLFADIDNLSAVCTFFATNNAADQVLTVGTAFQGVFGGDSWEFSVPHVNNTFAITNQNTRIYADPGSQISVSLNGSSPQATPCGVTLSGHLVTH